MNKIFIEILDNALTASLLIIAVIVVRLIIKRAPKWIACALWGLVAVKLVIPFRIESVLSLVPSAEPIPGDIENSATPHIETGVHAIDQAVNHILMESFTPQPEYSANLLQIVIPVCSCIWIAGIVCMLLYLLISYAILKKRVAASQNVYENVYICDEAASPFILGIIKPVIYLPSGLSPDATGCVLEHERAHLKICDHFWKPFGFLILSIYWFNPLCWIAYILLCRDIELACDEKVTKDKDNNWRATYCQALLDCNSKRRIIAACPVAFGEVGVKNRVKTVLSYKKPAFWIVVTAIIISAIVAVCFMTSPARKSTDENAASEDITQAADSDSPYSQLFAEGNFDNIMGYSGHYVYYGIYHTKGYYYADDGRLLAYVWGTVPEAVGIVDLDGDGKNELVAGLLWTGDGGTDVIVYKEFENGIRYAYCSGLMDEPYDNFGVGALGVEYLKDTNEIEFSYWVDAEQKLKYKTAGIDYMALTWWVPDWLETNETDYSGWICGTISEILQGSVNGTDVTISLKYYVEEDDSDMIKKLGLGENDFPSGYAVVPVGETRIYTIGENCEFIFVDWSHNFKDDIRVQNYDDVHVITKDYSVFGEYLDTYTSLNHQIFFFDIQDGKVNSIYEMMLP